jgi:organic radical activating enzyme
MEESEIKKFYEKNKSYCTMPFKEIYNDSAGSYRLCCHAKVYQPTAKYTTENTTPFEYFKSPEMEELRNKMLAGKKVDACRVCYKLEETSGKSYRNGEAFRDSFSKNYGIPLGLSAGKVGLKLRVFSTYCNLSCYMCHPFNSSTRRNEMKAIYGTTNFGDRSDGWALSQYKNPNYKQWNKIAQDILDNVELIGHINLTGGEPLQLPKHWELLDKIPEEHAKHITLYFNTNLTELRWKKWNIFDYVDKFEKIEFGVSCDHYGRKLDWMRYPIDREKFEFNLKEASSLVKEINLTSSLLNIFDLIEINNYYTDNFDKPMTFKNIVRGPLMLSIRNLKQKDKDILLKKYEKLPNYSYIQSELMIEPYDIDHIKMKKYCDELSKHRNFNWRELWNEY